MLEQQICLATQHIIVLLPPVHPAGDTAVTDQFVSSCWRLVDSLVRAPAQDGCGVCLPYVHVACVTSARLHRVQARQYSRQAGA